jgi:selenocysteine lyase/cysteine desulfurase
MEDDFIDILCFTGHKGLLGPVGTGGLVLGPRVPEGLPFYLKSGGTGSRSDQEEQPDFLPDKYECGTQNAAGIAGLGAGIEWVLRKGREEIRETELRLLSRLLGGLNEIAGMTVYSGARLEAMVPTVSINVDGLEPSEVGERLDEEYGIMTRIGLHCSPAAHKTLGTFPRGTVRLSLGIFTTEADIDYTIRALGEIAAGKK